MHLKKDSVKAFLKKLHLREVFAVLLVLSAVYFFRQQKTELQNIIPAIKNADSSWVIIGLVVTVFYILLQSLMYVFSFSAIKSRLPFLLSIELFLKRNLLSVFLPAGGVTSLAYMPGSLRKSGVHKQDVHNASAIYGFVGFLSIILVGIPIIFLAFTQKNFDAQALYGIAYLSIFLGLVLWVFYLLRKKGKFYHWLISKLPSLETSLDRLSSMQFTRKGFGLTVLASVGVEGCGIFHIYIAILALGLEPSLQAACVAYIVSIILLFTSPFLRGLGAVEVSLVFILTRYGYTATQALEITLLYRIFEFWLPLAAGVGSYAVKGRHIFMRLAPALLIFTLGVVNILSAITPPDNHRIFLLKQYIDTDVMHASNLLTILLGLLLLITAAYLIKGLKTAWIIAVAIVGLSLIMNITKALDWEEASFAFFTLLILFFTYKQYRLKSNKAAIHSGLITCFIVIAFVLLFETLGFYFLQKKHFHQEFTWADSFWNALHTFLLITNDDIKPFTRFGKDFIISIHTLSAGTIVFLIFSIFRASTARPQRTENDQELAGAILQEYGNTAVDYFKLATDKVFFFSPDNEGFISYRIAGGFAIVLDEPVCDEEDKIDMIKDFDKETRRLGLKQAYYRVDEDSLYYFEAVKKHKLLIGQEAVLDIEEFTLEGKDKKSLRNGLNSLSKKGFSTKIHQPPLKTDLLRQLKNISDEWLQFYDKKESVFSQGMFEEAELINHEVVALHDSTGNVVAFLNIIPDYTPGGTTYDMIRKSAVAPGAAMDALIIELIRHAKEKNLRWLNLGLVPFSGIENPGSPAERVVKFAYEKVKRFQHFQGLRDFKAKYASQWLNKYLIYDNDFDLVELPTVLNKVMVPVKEKNEHPMLS